MRNISFSPPDITETEINEVVDALKSGWITTGPKTKELERLVAIRCGTSRAVCLNSNTACMEVMLRILGIGAGDEVIVPAYTYTATASVVEHVGATIVMVDCAPDCFTLDYDMLEMAITKKTKAIIPVDLFGVPCDYDKIMGIVKRKRDLFSPSDNPIQRALGRCAVMVDAAHSFGARYKGVSVGRLADFTAFSFHAVKNLTTAEGGALTWKSHPNIDDDALYQQFMLMSLHGQNKDALAKTRLGAWEYDIIGPWYKCNMTDIHAAIGLGQMKRYSDMLERRREIIEQMDAAFVNLPLEVVSHYTEMYSSSGHLYIVRLFDKNGKPVNALLRNQFIEHMSSCGVATNVHYKPLPLHTAYKKLGFNIKDFPNAYRQFVNEITLPLHTCLDDVDVAYIIECVTKITNELLVR